MRARQTLVIGLLFFSTMLAVAGCEKKGPAERAGEKVDHAVATAGQAVENTGDKIKDAVDK